MIGTVGSPGRKKYECNECTDRSDSTVRPAATSACAATWPPNTRCRSSSGLRPRKRFTSSVSSSRSEIRSSSAVPMVLSQPTSSEEHARDVEKSCVDGLELAEGVLERNPHDIGPLQRDHDAELVLVRGVDGLDTEPGGEHAVEGRGRSAPQNVAEDRHPRLEAGALLDLLLHAVGDATQANVAERVDVPLLGLHRPFLGNRAFGDHDDGEARAVLVAAADVLTDVGDVERHFRNEDDVGATGEAGGGDRKS